MSGHPWSRRSAVQVLPGPALPDSPIRVEVVHYVGPTGPIARVELSPSSDIDGVVVVARDLDGRIAVVQQYRSAVDRTLWELPRGLGSTGSPQADARRELQEETGALAHRLEVLGPIHPDAGVQRQQLAVVRAWVHEPSTRPVDVDEIAAAAWWDPRRLQQAVADGVLCDGISLAALQLDTCTPLRVPNRQDRAADSSPDPRGATPGDPAG